MLQPDAFCEHTMQQNATAAGAPHLIVLTKKSVDLNHDLNLTDLSRPTLPLGLLLSAFTVVCGVTKQTYSNCGTSEICFDCERGTSVILITGCFVRVLESCCRLRLFDLSFCAGIDAASIATWRERYPRVQIKRSFQS